MNANKKMTSISDWLALRLYRLCSVCCVGQTAVLKGAICSIHTGRNLEQANALTEESHLGQTSTLSKDRAIAMGNTQLRHFYVKFRLSETE